MTLVAGISLGDMPAFIGDLLLSWRIPSEADLPTRPIQTVHPGETGYYAKSLAQKLVIVRPYFLLVWAGCQSNAERILRQVDQILPENFDDISDFHPLFSVLDTCAADSEMVAIIIGNGMVRPICMHTRGFEIDGKRVYIMGTGGPAFLEYLTSHPETLPTSDTDNLMARAVALRFAARAIATQWITGSGLESSWGGGFEVAYPTPSGFQKIDRTLFRAWKINEDGEYVNSGRSFFVRYHGTDLYLSTFNPGERTYLVLSPIGAKVLPPPFEIARAAWTVDIFIHEPNGRLTEFVRFHPDDRPADDFVELSDGFITGWSMDKTHVDRCARTALYYRNSDNIFMYHKY